MYVISEPNETKLPDLWRAKLTFMQELVGSKKVYFSPLDLLHLHQQPPSNRALYLLHEGDTLLFPSTGHSAVFLGSLRSSSTAKLGSLSISINNCDWAWTKLKQ